MGETWDGSGSAPTQDERTFATLAQGLQLIGSWIAPLIIFLIKRQSRFVSFHALQALLWQVSYTILVVLTFVGWFVAIFFTIAFHAASKTTPSPAIFMFFPLIWLVFITGGILNLVLAIVYAIKAGQGEWAEYPVLGRLARKLLRLGPGGVPLAEPA